MMIESFQNARVKRLLNLQKNAKHRKKEGAFVVEGLREVERAIKSNFECLECWAVPSFFKNFQLPISALKIQCTKAIFEKIAYRGQSADVVAIFKSKEFQLENFQLPNNALIAVLENIEKPGNIGAVIRTCNGLGVDALFICDSAVDIYNPNVIRNSLGGFFDLPIISLSSKQAIDFFVKENVQIITTHLEASIDYATVDFKEPTAVVFGSEANGLSEQWVKSTNQNVIVRMFGVVDSLNISAAAAIVLSEAIRQRR